MFFIHPSSVHCWHWGHRGVRELCPHCAVFLEGWNYLQGKKEKNTVQWKEKCQLLTKYLCNYFRRCRSLWGWWQYWSIAKNAWKPTDKLGKTASGEEKSTRMVTGCGFQKNNDLNVRNFEGSLGKWMELSNVFAKRKFCYKIIHWVKAVVAPPLISVFKGCQTLHPRCACVHSGNEHIVATISHVLSEKIEVYFL